MDPLPPLLSPERESRPWWRRTDRTGSRGEGGDRERQEKERLRSLQRLRGLDPEYAESLDRNDWYRLKRALDICTQSGR